MTNQEATAGGSGDAPPPPASPDPPLIVQSKDLLQGRREVWIAHGGAMYRLRVTGGGKLYLTK